MTKLTAAPTTSGPMTGMGIRNIPGHARKYATSNQAGFVSPSFPHASNMNHVQKPA